jgi:hypothetical protein
MATERLSVRKAREILRQKWELGRTHREIAAGVGQSLGAVAMTLGRAAAAGLDWAQAQALTDTALEDRIYGPKAETLARPMPIFEYLHAERRKPGVTLELLHLEYLEKHPAGYRYTQFWSGTSGREAPFASAFTASTVMARPSASSNSRAAWTSASMVLAARWRMRRYSRSPRTLGCTSRIASYARRNSREGNISSRYT